MTNLLVGGTNLTNINFANIGEQIKFIDTMKYYQQSLSALAATVININIQCKNFVNRDKKLNQKLFSCSGRTGMDIRLFTVAKMSYSL